MITLFVLNAMHILLIGVHLFCRAKFHDHQFAERDAFATWAQRQFRPTDPVYGEVKRENKKWHRWLWLQIISLILAYTLLIGAASLQQPFWSLFGTWLVGIGFYTALIDPLVSMVALERGFLYIGEADRVRVLRLRLLRKLEPGLTSFILRASFLLVTIITKIIIWQIVT